MRLREEADAREFQTRAHFGGKVITDASRRRDNAESFPSSV